MGIQLQDNTGTIITSPDPIATPDQQVANTSGNLVNPSTEETLNSVKLQTDKLNFTGLKLQTDAAFAGTIGAVNITHGATEHWNGTATATPATVTFSGTSETILLSNTSSNTDMRISFDAGSKIFTIAKKQSLSIDTGHASVEVSTASGTAGYEMLVVV